MPQLKLFFSPRACSLACHIALEESGLPFVAEAVKIREGQHKTDKYLCVNPWGKIPAMLIDGELLTESHAILSYIADTAAIERQLKNVSRSDVSGFGPIQQQRSTSVTRAPARNVEVADDEI